MSGNELKYTSLTVDDILKQVYDQFLKTPDGETNHKFDNFRESAIAQTLIEVFAGVVDINNYYIQRRSEECFYDTAQLKSSVISLSRMFGYVMNRREPSRAKIRMKIEGDIQDNQVQIPYYSKFAFSGKPYVLVNTMTYRIPDDIYSQMGPTSEISIDVDSFGNSIDIVQGTIKEKIINGATNSQVNAPFQIYKIEDKTFSNVYGEKDFFYNDVTQVYVGENKIPIGDENSTQFSIDRRSLLNWENINKSNLSVAQSVCVIRTSPDGFVEVLFGDGDPGATNTSAAPDATGGFSRKGAVTRKDNIYVQYLSCEGQSTNSYGVLGDKVDFNGKIYNSNGTDITSNISFELISNVYGGANDESMDSIKYSSPKIYYSLDRLITKQDYVAYLKTLTTPINVQNAVAWGEQEERDRYRQFAMVKMYNTTLFTTAGSLYDLDANPHVAKTGSRYEDVVLDINYDPYGFQTQGYFNVFVMQQMVNQLNRYYVQSTFNEIDGTIIGYETTTQTVTQADGSTVEATTKTAKTEAQVATSIQSSISTQFPSGSAPISFTYTSDDKKNVSNITGTGTVTVKNIKHSDFTNKDGKDYLIELASKVNTALVGFKDARGNRVDNKNFGKQSFIGRKGGSTTIWSSGDVIIWDYTDIEGEQNTFSYRMRFNDKQDGAIDISPCYIKFIDNGTDTLAGIMAIAGKSVTDSTETYQTNEMNGKISTIVNDLENRSQVNVKNIYVSPILHRFYLTGDINVKPLYDLVDTRTDITNNIYNWLDINADFNQPIYLSNITEIVEAHPGVTNCNIKLVPEDITMGQKNTTNLYYDPNPATNTVYKKYQTRQNPSDSNSDPITNNVNPISKIINDELYAYITGSYNNIVDSNNPTTDIWYRNFYTYRLKGIGDEASAEGSRSSTLEFNSYALRNNINERTFYNDFARKVYNTLFKQTSQGGSGVSCSGETYICTNNGLPNYSKFLGIVSSDANKYNSDVVHQSALKSDFAITMEQIHKDLSYIIMENMIDSNGNIDIEYNSNNEYVRGGYSLGSEIAQIIMDNNINPNLNFRYK